MNPKLVKKLSLGAESYVKITWKDFFTQCEVLLSSIVDHKLYISDYDSDSVASETSLREACYVYVRFMLKSWSIVPCEQCLLQARRYATKGEKPLRATVCFSIEHACPRDTCVKWQHLLLFRRKHFGNIRNLNIQRQDDNENVNKTVGLISKTTTLQVHHPFLSISLPFLYDYDVKMPTFVFYG